MQTRTVRVSAEEVIEVPIIPALKAKSSPADGLRQRITGELKYDFGYGCLNEKGKITIKILATRNDECPA